MAKVKSFVDMVVKRAARLADQVRAAFSGSTKINSDPDRQGNSTTIFGHSAVLGRTDSATWMLGAAVVLAIVVLFLVGGRGANAQGEATEIEVKRGVVEVTTTGTGSIESARDTELNFETDGTVTEVFVEEGAQVKEGQAIAKVDRRSAKLAVEVAKANLDDLESGISTSTTNNVSYGSGSTDSTTTKLVAYTAPVSTQTIAAYPDTSDQATTGDTGVVCADDEAQVTDPDTGEVTCETAGPTGATGVTGPTGPTGPSGGKTGGDPTVPQDSKNPGATPETTAPSGGRTSAAGVSGGSASSGSQSGGGSGSVVSDTDLKSAKLDLAEAREAYRNTILRAPFPGTIVSLDGAVGDSVSAGSSGGTNSSSDDSALDSQGASGSNSASSSSSAFAVIQQLNSLEMSINVPEADINDVEQDQRATVTVSSADDEQLAAKVINVGLLADTSGDVVTYPVTVRVQSGSSKVRPGMSASVSIVTDQASGAINVPNQALSGNSVKVENPDSGEETVTVEVGLVGDSSTQILSGLEAGDIVLIPQPTASSSGTAGSSEGDSTPGVLPGGSPRGGSSTGRARSGGGFPSGGAPGS